MDPNKYMRKFTLDEWEQVSGNNLFTRAFWLNDWARCSNIAIEILQADAWRRGQLRRM
jgi:hypothetical protein